MVCRLDGLLAIAVRSIHPADETRSRKTSHNLSLNSTRMIPPAARPVGDAIGIRVIPSGRCRRLDAEHAADPHIRRALFRALNVEARPKEHNREIHLVPALMEAVGELGDELLTRVRREAPPELSSYFAVSAALFCSCNRRSCGKIVSM